MHHTPSLRRTSASQLLEQLWQVAEGHVFLAQQNSRNQDAVAALDLFPGITGKSFCLQKQTSRFQGRWYLRF